MHKMLKEIQELNEDFQTRTPSTLTECENKINNSKGGGFVGYIPDFMLEKIPSGKSEVDFFKMFNNFVLQLKKSKVQQAELTLNQFFNNTIKFSLEKSNYRGSFISFGVIIKNNINNKDLFLKVFKKNYKEGQMFHYRHGPYIETAVALFITHHLKDSPYFAKFYFANPKEVYMVTEYVHQCMDIREDFRAMEVRKIEDVDIKDKLVTEFFQKITGEEISHYKILKTLKGGCFRYLDYLYDNFIVYEDENKNKHVKMVDFGWCISYNENLRVV